LSKLWPKTAYSNRIDDLEHCSPSSNDLALRNGQHSFFENHKLLFISLIWHH